MFEWLFCEHDYRIIDKKQGSYMSDIGIRIYFRDYILYCPKCDKEKTVDADKYDLEQKKKLIKKEYYNK